jgi:hypothetical protein
MLLDGCLINCHMQERSDASDDHCHQTAQSNATESWQATSTCGHDHDGPSAEAVFQTRSDAPSKVSGLAIASDAIEIAGVPDFILRRYLAPAAHRPLSALPLTTPLRV